MRMAAAMRLLLTGAAGFIGSHVRGLLQQRGHEVTGVDCYLSQVHGHNPREVSGVWRAAVSTMAAQWSEDPNHVYDAVVHLAAGVGVGQSQYEPARYIRGNVAETADLWRTAQWVLRNDLHKHVPADNSGTALAELRQMGMITG